LERWWYLLHFFLKTLSLSQLENWFHLPASKLLVSNYSKHVDKSTKSKPLNTLSKACLFPELLKLLRGLRRCRVLFPPWKVLSRTSGCLLSAEGWSPAGRHLALLHVQWPGRDYYTSEISLPWCGCRYSVFVQAIGEVLVINVSSW